MYFPSISSGTPHATCKISACPKSASLPKDFMVWLLSIFMERCKRLFMGISGVSSFYPAPPKSVKPQKNGVKNGICLLAVRREF
jgi:hypothetical protein